MIPDYIPECRRNFSGDVGNTDDSPSGATEEAILALEESLGTKLPTSYRQLLSWAGTWSGGPLKGSDWLIHQVESNTQSFRKYAEEHLSEMLDVERQAVCIFCHQGYVWCWLYPDEGENPPVHGFDESKKGKIYHFDTLQAWFLTGF